MKNILEKLAAVFVDDVEPTKPKVTIENIIARKTSYVLHSGKLYKITAEEAEVTKKD
jgi:hypothetical protein